ncbi:MAG: HvfC/BufC family peptide modification chaperone [Bryobacteraceae bacterium]
MQADLNLIKTQRWMQEFILAPGEPEAALQETAQQLVKPSDMLTSLERVGVYRGMYLLRLVEALETDYPAVRHFLGEDGFYNLVARYVDQYPSRSYNLNRLGDHFPEFVKTQADLPKHEFLCDLARLELALTEVFDAEETPVLTPEAIAAVPPDAWETARLQPIAALRLLAFDYPVSAYLGGVDEENPFPKIRRQPTWVLAYRNQFQQHRSTLGRPAFELLHALIAGAAVGEAVDGVATSQKKLFGWFRDWMANGLFQSILRG